MINHNSIQTISQADCRSVYSIKSVTDRMFCVFEEGNGPCVGDTGSPAALDRVLIGNNNEYDIHGTILTYANTAGLYVIVHVRGYRAERVIIHV